MQMYAPWAYPEFYTGEDREFKRGVGPRSKHEAKMWN